MGQTADDQKGIDLAPMSFQLHDHPFMLTFLCFAFASRSFS